MRRMMCTLMSFSKQVPLVAIERRMKLGDLLHARKQLAEKPSWFALFMKAYSLVSREMPVLRQSFLTFPWQRLHQHSCTVASVTIARQIDEEDAVFFSQIRFPETMTLADLDKHLKQVREAPVLSIPDFRRQHLHGRLPGFIRNSLWWLAFRGIGSWRARYCGTFGITSIAALGSASLHTISPLTSVLAYGVLEADGSVLVRLFYDHRIMDGVQPAMALAKVEQALNSTLKQEMLEQFPALGRATRSSSWKTTARKRPGKASISARSSSHVPE